MVTLQDDVINILPESLRDEFQGQRVWLNSRNVALRELEDRLLSKAQDSPHITIEQGPPDEVWRGGDLDTYRAWLELIATELDAQTVIAADGAGSRTRQAYHSDFGHINLGSTDPQLLEVDYALGIGLRDDGLEVSPEQQALNTLLTLSQNRYSNTAI